MLRTADYPVYSNGVISRSRQKGLTLVKFWKQTLLYRWQNTSHGKIIWRTEGSKNRYHSELCNRNPSFPFYREYLEEILNDLTPREFVQAADQFAQFLLSKNYSHDAFLRKLTGLVELGQLHDPLFQGAAATFFRASLNEYDNHRLASISLDSWFFIMLSLHAMADDASGTDLLSHIRSSSAWASLEGTPVIDNNTLISVYLQAGENAKWMGDLNLLGEIALQEGNLTEAAGYFKEMPSLVEIYTGKETMSYILTLAKLAILYNKMGETSRNRSYEYHKTAIALLKKLAPESPDMQVLLNNYAVALLDGNRPEEAAPVLEQALKLAEQMPSIALAESSFQMSRLYHMKGDLKKERHYLEKALPVFHEVYGEEHEKTKIALERWNAL